MGGQLWQHPEWPCRKWGWAPAPSRPGGSFSPRCAGHPAGRRSAGPLPGTVPKEGTVLRRLRLPAPAYKGGGGGGGCSRHRTRAPRAAGHRQCVSVGTARGERGKGRLCLGGCPLILSAPFPPPHMGVPHPWVLEQGSEVPAVSQRCADCSQALPSSVWDGQGAPSESHFLEGPLGHPQGWELSQHHLVPSPRRSGDFGEQDGTCTWLEE